MSDEAVIARVGAAVESVLERQAFRAGAQSSARPALERDVRAALEPFKRRGAISAFVVRCDDDTCEGSSAPVVEIILRLPRRVEQVLLRFGGG
ncbi:MAG: hypothetical protein R3F39_24955 [Myxococcota bacterium]